MYKLHGFSQSGNTYKVALLLQALQQPWEAVHVQFEAFSAGVTRSQEWRQEHNAMGEVPILEVDGKRLTQSAAIMLHLAEKHGAFGLALEYAPLRGLSRRVSGGQRGGPRTGGGGAGGVRHSAS